MGRLVNYSCARARVAVAIVVAASALTLWTSDSAHAQLRIVTYNTHFDGPFPGLATVLEAIGETDRNGIAKPIDVLLLQEQDGPFGDTQEIVDILNGIYGAGAYNQGERVGGSTSDIRQTMIYNTHTIQFTPLTDEAGVGTANSNGQPRQALRYRLRPIEYDTSAEFFVYNSHYRAGDTPGDEADRLIEANVIRNSADALSDDTHVIYAGDHNFYRSTDDAFERLTQAGDAQAIDPLNRIGNWNNSSSFSDVHTQAPCASGCNAGFTTGGMDDRFDFQLMTAEFLDGEGLSMISGSYHAFGNNGTTYNQNINIANNTVTFPGVTSFTKQQILNALLTSSDHIPVVADYQLPAVLSAVAGMVPATLDVGEIFNLGLTVNNSANVLQPIGADELDYSVTTSGSVLGSFFNQLDAALGGSNLHELTLDTSTPGLKTGTIFVQSASQAVQNAQIQIPISYEVLATALTGDFNEDGTVDAADYTVWRDGLGTTYVQDDYLVWKNNFGQSLGSGGGGFTAVPEPNALLLLVVGVCLLASVSRRGGQLN